MERSSFIELLEQCKAKALRELARESEVQAALLIPEDFKQAIIELENTCKTVTAGFEKVAKEVSDIAEANVLPDKYNRCYFSTPSTQILSSVLGNLGQKIRELPAFKQKKNEITVKFDAAIKAAKASRPASKLKELADALGIETPSIEMNQKSATEGIDTEYVKEKIKSVLLLK